MNQWISESEIKALEVNLSDSKRGARLHGNLRIPPAPVGWVIFAHGSGSSRFSPRNIQVAKALNQRHLATLLFDLLSNEESDNRKNVFDIPLLADRLLLATKWLKNQIDYNGAPLAFFGASTGAAAALSAASLLKNTVQAVVSRGGRVDLARQNAPEVNCPTLLIVGGWDEPVLSWNRDVLPLLPKGHLKVIPNATHLFEEPHALPAVIEASGEFFSKHLSTQTRRPPAPSPFP